MGLKKCGRAKETKIRRFEAEDEEENARELPGSEIQIKR